MTTSENPHCSCFSLILVYELFQQVVHPATGHKKDSQSKYMTNRRNQAAVNFLNLNNFFAGVGNRTTTGAILHQLFICLVRFAVASSHNQKQFRQTLTAERNLVFRKWK